MQGEAANATLGLKEQLLAKDPYQHNNLFNQKGFVFYIEGKKGEEGKEWGAANPARLFGGQKAGGSQPYLVPSLTAPI
jgi:hypothetical protein